MASHTTASDPKPLAEVLDPVNRKNTGSLQKQFQFAAPFRHIVMESFLAEPFLQNILKEFPEPQTEAMVSEFGDRSLKHTVENIETLGPAFLRWHALLQSAEFIQFLESVTGIPNLRFDPSYWGAGTHNNLHGQSLDLHVDFNHHPLTGFHRRLNLIVYLCPEWETNWGGSIELHRNAWDRSAAPEAVQYAPLLNRAVLFETGEHTWHGFREIKLPLDKRHLSRKSLTVYYYTETLETGEPAQAHSTVYVPGWIPSTVKPGEMLTKEAYDDLEALMYRRDHYLKRLYREHHRVYAEHRYLLRRLRPFSTIASKLGLRPLLKRLFKPT